MLAKCVGGAGVIQPRAVEMGFRYGVPIHVRSTFSNTGHNYSGGIYTVESNKLRNYRRSDTMRLQIQQSSSCWALKINTGNCGKSIQSISRKNVDTGYGIVQSIRSVGEPKTDLIFTIALDDVVLA